ncbi:hypothetical protein ABK905_19475 [Acerihabitans sp. KWT182]|uniref:Uncharacterized protein n=1 Tax=Acerihabitans sp. KWT182 TaxID=3157919 RepID=A0AAU7Q6J6_9GAMM
MSFFRYNNHLNTAFIADEERKANRLFECVDQLRRHPELLSSVYGLNFIRVVDHDKTYFLQSRSLNMPGGDTVEVGYSQGKRVIALGDVYHIENMISPPKSHYKSLLIVLGAHLTHLRCLAHCHPLTRCKA